MQALANQYGFVESQLFVIKLHHKADNVVSIMNKLILIFLSSLLSLSSITLNAQEQNPVSEPETPEIKITRKAEALSKVVVEYPSELRIFGQEGWVELGFIIDKEGNVIEPIIEGSVGGPVFEEAAIAALDHLKYKPALYKGVLVEESVTGLFIPFILEQTFEGVDTDFASSFNGLLDLFNANQLTEADAALLKLSKSQDLTLSEVSMLEVARGYSAVQNKKPYKQLQHLRNASVNYGAYLHTEMLGRVLQTRIALAAKMSLFDEAQKSFELLEHADPSNEKLTPLAMMIAPIQNALALGQIVQVQGTISERGYWTYQPIRRNFSFATADAGITEFEPRCEIRNQRFSMTTESEWRIPKSWGACMVVIYGEPGANFSLYEYADSKE